MLFVSIILVVDLVILDFEFMVILILVWDREGVLLILLFVMVMKVL